MVYYAEGMELEVISYVLRGSVNDVLVCRNRLSAAGTQYTVLNIHDRDCARKMLLCMENNERTGESPCLFRFTQNESLLFAFPYREERKFSAFAKGQITSLAVGEHIGVNLVMECLSTGLPWPLLYLVLEQGGVQITIDNEIYFNYGLDLENLRPEISEKNCVASCARILLGLLSAQVAGSRRRRRKKLRSFELIQKKESKHAYTDFPELYHDIKLTALPGKKVKATDRVKGVWRRNRDRLFHVLLFVCAVLVIIALVMLISQIIFGEIPLLRLFQNSFDVIGTENLHKGGRP